MKPAAIHIREPHGICADCGELLIDKWHTGVFFHDSECKESRTIYMDSDSVMRLEAYANGNLLANCEECGEPIPVELSLCSNCADRAEYEIGYRAAKDEMRKAKENVR